jgi:hypothetical protein
MSGPTPEDRERLNKALDGMEMPPTPLTPMEEVGQAWRGAYEVFRAAEFTEAQALYLAAVIMTGQPGIPPQH